MSSSSAPTVSSLDATKFNGPSGTKCTTNRCLPGPIGCNPNAPPESSYPVLLYKGYTFWPLSYEDNRVSFAVVITSSSNNQYLSMFEAPGSRYIDSIRVFSGNSTVNFVGQGFQSASISWDTLARQANVGGSQQSSSITTLSTSTTRAPTSASTISSSSSSSLPLSSGSPTPLSTDAPPPPSGAAVPPGVIAGATIGSIVGVIGLAILGRLGYKKMQERQSATPRAPLARPASAPKASMEVPRQPTPEMNQQEKAEWMKTVGKVAQQIQMEQSQGARTDNAGTATAVNQREAEDQMTPLVNVKNSISRPTARRDVSGGTDSGQSTLPGESMGPPQSDAGRAADRTVFGRD